MKINQNLIDLLDSVKVTEPISKDVVKKIIKEDSDSLDSSYYSKTEHSTFEVSGYRYARLYIEWSHGYFLCIIDRQTRAFECAFIDLHYGDWKIMETYKNEVKFREDIKELNSKVDTWRQKYIKTLNIEDLECDIQKLLAKGINCEEDANRLEKMTEKLNNLKKE